jgi:SAM-dependent methyltransferase
MDAHQGQGSAGYEAPTSEFYDHIVSYRERDDVGFYVELVSSVDGPVLELGHGTGRILIPIARAGKEIVGLDASPSMKAICDEKLEQEPEEVRSRVCLMMGTCVTSVLDNTSISS